MVRIDLGLVGKDKDSLKPIVRWGVLFQTPIGLFDNVNSANDELKACDLDSMLCIRPVVVAYSEDYYEVLA